MERFGSPVRLDLLTFRAMWYAIVIQIRVKN